MRKAVMTLQSAFRLHGSEEITANDFSESGGVIPDDVIEKVVGAIHSGEFAACQKVSATIY